MSTASTLMAVMRFLDDSAAFDRMTERICEIYQEELDIPGNHIYVEYRATKDWGWNGRNF